MAQCETGYSCSRCGEYVETIRESALYLRYIIGECGIQDLIHEPEAHLRCMPELAQFIIDPAFHPPSEVDSDQDKRLLSREERIAREERITAGWRRLQSVLDEGVPLEDYPLPS